MNKLQKTFGQVGFTAQEKMDLAARLQQAAEQEEIMTDAAKRKVKKISRGMIIGIAAACLLTVGALAAALSPGLRSYFDAGTPGAQEILESGIHQLNRSETYNGWTVALTECVGDDNNAYIWVDITAPEGTVLETSESKGISGGFTLLAPESFDYLGMWIKVPDEDPLDNQISRLIYLSTSTPLRGETFSFSIGPLIDWWWVDYGTETAQQYQGSELTEAIRDHEWVFEDVVLDYPDQTIRLTPDMEVPYLDGTAALTKLEVSPLNVTVRLEGGSCSGQDISISEETVVTGSDVTISVGTDSGSYEPESSQQPESPAVELHMKDGSVLVPNGDSSFSHGSDYVERSVQYADSGSDPDRIIDPTQVDYVTVCGVDVPMPEAETTVEEPLSVWQWIFKTYWNN